MSRKKKTIVNKTQSARLETAEPKKGESTFSIIDSANVSDTEKNPKIDIPWNEIVESLKADKQISITLDDERQDPKIIVEPKINVEAPIINVKPTPIEVKVPTPVPQPAPRPVINVEKPDLVPLCYAAFLIALLLAIQLGITIWQLPM